MDVKDFKTINTFRSGVSILIAQVKNLMERYYYNNR
jgi:hypothetical protein